MKINSQSTHKGKAIPLRSGRGKKGGCDFFSYGVMVDVSIKFKIEQ